MNIDTDTQWSFWDGIREYEAKNHDSSTREEQKPNKMSALPRVPTVAEVMAGVKRAQSNIFKPVTKESMCYHYLPLLGAKSYVELSLAMAAPRALGRLYTSIGLSDDMNTMNSATAASCP